MTIKGTGIPSRAHRVPHTLRGTNGDLRVLAPGQTAQLIDVEYETPRALLAIVMVHDATSGAAQFADFKIVTGMNNGQLDEETIIATAGMQRAILARSVTINATNNTAFTLRFRSIIVELDVTVDSSIFGTNGLGGLDTIVDPSIGASFYVINQYPVSTVSQGMGIVTLGAAFYNYSPGGAFLYLRFGGGLASLSVFSVRLAPMTYYEMPEEWRGVSVEGIWDIADAAGFANVTYRI